jgi:Zn finger protein HypA/HybF involved in hydrogenase expression
MAKNEPYRSLPEGPVLCDDCSRAGSEVEMEPHDALPHEARKWSEEQEVELQSYRCPDCESIQVFRVN